MEAKHVAAVLGIPGDYPKVFREEAPIIARCKENDETALLWLNQHTLPVRRHVAKCYLPSADCAVYLEDAVAESWFAVLNALDRYALSFGIRFIDYSVHRIVWKVTEFARNNRLDVRHPSYLYKKHAEIRNLLSIGHSLSEVASRTGDSEQAIQKILTLYHSQQSLNAPLPGDHEGEATYMDVLASPEETHVESIERDDRYQEVRESLMHLEPMERQIIEMSNGLDGGCCLNDRAIAKLLRIKETAVKTKKATALTKLRYLTTAAGYTGSFHRVPGLDA